MPRGTAARLSVQGHLHAHTRAHRTRVSHFSWNLTRPKGQGLVSSLGAVRRQKMRTHLINSYHSWQREEGRPGGSEGRDAEREEPLEA